MFSQRGIIKPGEIMIAKQSGNLFSADVEALVNTVNTVGVMGKGVALQFKKNFPANFKEYKRLCELGDLVTGKVFVFHTGTIYNPKYIINFPTKEHWRANSRLEFIVSGLKSLVDEIRKLGIKSVAIPPLGCGNGGLSWKDVFPLIEAAFDQIPEVRALVFEPAGAPTPIEMTNRTSPPQMTTGRAAIIGLMNRYAVPGYDYRLSLLEVQKLAYFMQEAGEPLKLQFAKGPYGPYADNLRHVLNHIEGHFVTGFGDGKNQPDTELKILPGAAEQAAEFLKDKDEVTKRFERVTELIEGFETPYGMELLSSVHWVARDKSSKARADVEAAIVDVHAWTERKKLTMQPAHIKAAWNRLHTEGWI